MLLLIQLTAASTLLSLLINTVSALRCYSCEYVKCPPMVTNCRPQHDICTVENFKRYEVQQVDCPGPCETYSISDPNGSIMRWHRRCSLQGPPSGSGGNICHSVNVLAFREDICICSGHLCNHSVQLKFNVYLIFLTTLSCLLFFNIQT